jgi:hypothetical protein
MLPPKSKAPALSVPCPWRSLNPSVMTLTPNPKPLTLNPYRNPNHGRSLNPLGEDHDVIDHAPSLTTLLIMKRIPPPPHYQLQWPIWWLGGYFGRYTCDRRKPKRHTLGPLPFWARSSLANGSWRTNQRPPRGGMGRPCRLRCQRLHRRSDRHSDRRRRQRETFFAPPATISSQAEALLL